MFRFALLAAAVVAVGGFTTAQAKGDAEAGKAIYAKQCKACHGAEGKGNPAIIKSSKGTLQDITSKEVQSRSDEQLKKDIVGGTPTKKPVKIAGQQLEDVLAYVRTLK